MQKRARVFMIQGISFALITIVVYLLRRNIWINIIETSFSFSNDKPIQADSIDNNSINVAAVEVFRLLRLKNLTIDKLSDALENENELKLDRSLPVPNVVHYIWFGANRTFTFMQYLSFRSVHVHLVPHYIFIHGDHNPNPGYWWNRTLAEVRNIYFVHAVRPIVSPSGKPWHFFEHSTDVTRIKLLIDYGGIYLDMDILVLKSFVPLRVHSMVMGREAENQINSGIILAKRNAHFLRLWLETYNSYSGEYEGWAEKATVVPHELARLFPNLIHVEENSLNKPNYYNMHLLYLEHYNWSDNYAIHVWQRLIPKYPVGMRVPQRPQDIDRLDTTLGEITRYILYGSKEMRNLTN